MSRKISFKGNPMTLAGRTMKIGAVARDFRVISKDLKEVSLKDFNGKTKIITTFPSLDTPVCDLQVKEFNKRAVDISKDVIVLAISKDLPFAQGRFCETFGINNIKVLSDYKTSSFGINYGLVIKELNLLARSAIILDRNNVLRYVQIVGELTEHPDYEDVLNNLKDVIKDHAPAPKENLPGHCVPCEKGAPPLPKEKSKELLAALAGWQLIDDKKIAKEFKFGDFSDAKYFLDIISVIAEEQGHHPDMALLYNKLKIELTTHSAGGLTKNDFVMAKMIDEINAD